MQTRLSKEIFSKVKKKKNSSKIMKRKRDFGHFWYSVALVQKTKNVLYLEHLISFLYKCEAIPEMTENCISGSGFLLISLRL